ncbi:hypothetical protein B0H17DRAFT_1218340 [Mycena rosella]|uniref:DUF6589 domain-containing protein n=1 Tax=Mycena rosella TaxID=1033263 RepID=A0AAD7BQL8_MYCRO|nr:hypothetical protein B0H17DRAFT_1218340 [Mycena rosella]
MQNSLRVSEATSVDNPNPVPVGSAWVARGSSSSVAEAHDSDMPDLVKITDPADGETAPTVAVPTDNAPKVHQEHPGFTGDRVLRNSQIFMLEFGWWIEMAWAVPEGDIGRVWEMGDLDLRNEIRLVASGEVYRRRGRQSVRRVYSAQIQGSKSKMTVAVYQGENAEEAWRADVAQYSRLR